MGARPDDPQPLTPVCAMGASAGGVSALKSFFGHVKSDLGLAYVVIVHLAPNHPSSLSEILASQTRMPVQQVEDSAKLQPNCVYVIPPNRELVIAGDDVTARPFTGAKGRRSPIDMFFESVAAARGDGIAILLSGSGSDGTVGVRAVKEAGGVIFAQEPSEAEYPMMPESAIATGVVDFVCPIATLTERLSEVMRSKRAIRKENPEDKEQSVMQIIAFLRRRTGHDFSHYKRPTIMRRLSRRMQVVRQESFSRYYQYLQNNKNEINEFFSDLLISVTASSAIPKPSRLWLRMSSSLCSTSSRTTRRFESGSSVAQRERRRTASAFYCSKRLRGVASIPACRFSPATLTT